MYRVVETDNYGGDYPDERFVGPAMVREDCERVAAIMNQYADRRFFKVELTTYDLAPGFEP